MKINELVTKARNKNFDFNTGLQIKNYLPIMEKKSFVTDVIALYTDDIDGFITVDRFNMNIYFDMKMMAVYTNLDISSDFNEMVAQYDELCENGLLDKIITLIDDEYTTMNAILEDDLDELLVQNSIDVQVVKIANKISSFIDNISENMGNILPEGTDIQSLLETLNILK